MPGDRCGSSVGDDINGLEVSFNVNVVEHSSDETHEVVILLMPLRDIVYSLLVSWYPSGNDISNGKRS